ncbi:hypothetical protein [Cryobacterium sp. Y11]|uniref:hypothetical protein n=1 Tax=Cryobacterium sp. Y11 TaxID=2045016 RepID=UPI000CE3F3B8|nr:hypothetical protein [Cryobacterium sp. Y11]
MYGTIKPIGLPANDIVDSLHNGNSVVIFAPLGHGKSVLFDSVARGLRALGSEPLLIATNPLLHSVPFGSITSQLTFAESSAEGELTTALLLRYAQDRSGHGRPVILVDDAHFLDAPAMDSLSQLATAQAVVLLLTSDLVPPVDTTDTTDTNASTIHLLDELWIRGGAQRIDLEPLTALQSGQLLREFAPHAQFDRVALALLHSRSGGSRLLLRELTSETVRQQTLPRDHDCTAFALYAPSQRILDLLSHQLRSLHPSQLVSLALIGGLNGISTGRAAMICDAADLRDLIRRGYLFPSTARSGVLQTGPLLSEAALAICDAAQLHTQRALIVSILLTDRTHGFTTTPAECTMIADSWTASVGLAPGVIATWGSSAVADVLLVAARRSRRLGLTEKALQYSALSLRIEPGLKTTIEYSRALAGDERYLAALHVLHRAEKLLENPTDGVKLVRWQVSLATFTTMTADDFTALRKQIAGWFPGDVLMNGEVDFIRLTQSMQNLDWARVAIDGEAIAQNSDYDLITRI